MLASPLTSPQQFRIKRHQYESQCRASRERPPPQENALKITEFSLRNPLVVTILSLAVVLYGLISFFSLGVSVFPDVTFPGVTIATVDPGADPSTIETQITKPIEDAL